MRFEQCIRRVYTEPWLIIPEMHRRIADVLEMHITGKAHEAGIMDLFGPAEKPKAEIVDGVSVIPVKGVISKDISAMEQTSGAVDVDAISDLIEDAMNDESVRAMVLDVDSPGGTVTGVPELGDKITEARDEKPIIAHTSSLMASSAYWISAGASAIYASKSGVVGSIGVYLPIIDEQDYYQSRGVSVDLIKAGKFKGAGYPGTRLTDDQRADLQDGVDYLFNQFRGHVTASRKVQIDAMEGQTFYADQGIDVGLVDSISDLATAINDARTLADR